ncbi:camphor resistance protein CrcB [Maritimibacter alkaliphilus HTCC2654]|uniref:Fluoride-specific ion channel FluC n=1 Tax=Maritimibacter alkaliphilus HTCC2654 TaxID=314271 RepID=A3VFA0_9RHOB|nr:fluoride efflux transporter CrcB [Maritimibacter alkaliphilus]EAQ13015.1 CrcB-like protein [Rhodobacterales bacterium HTCC2654] [Maritimibacter alkaliphilus HTCC2654]TYP79949.1 camphor resistance protein CrcB [Maritimibacter alkaliphilus HTCC2654]
MLNTLLTVALGGAIGASGRYLVNVTATRVIGHGYPAGTLIVNVLGSFLMGVLFVVLAKKGGNVWAPFLMTGVLGGFTTFSAFSLDTLALFERGQVASAAGYVALSVGLSLAALVLGVYAARGVFA